MRVILNLNLPLQSIGSCAADASVLCTKKERITACTTMVCGAEGAVVKYASSQGAVGLLPFALMSAHTIAKVSEAVAKVCSSGMRRFIKRNKILVRITFGTVGPLFAASLLCVLLRAAIVRSRKHPFGSVQGSL